MHPFIPFVTEDIFLKLSTEESIMISSWPKAGKVSKDSIDKFKIFEEMITRVRNLRSEYQVIPSKKININLITSNEEVLNLYKEFKDVIVKFLNPNNLTISCKLETNEETLLITSLETRIYVDKADIIDREREIEALTKQLQELKQELTRSERMLSNENFISRAKPEKVQEEKQKYEEYLKQYKAVEEELKNMTNKLSSLIHTLERQVSINPKNNMKRVKDAIASFNLDFSHIKKFMLVEPMVKVQFVNT